MNYFRFAAVLALATLPLAAACNDDGDPVEPGPTTFNVQLTKAAEVPVCQTAGANAAGSATVTINADNTTITVSNLTFTGLSGVPMLAHIHSGALGVAGNVVINFGATQANPLVIPFTHTYTSADYTAAAGAPATFAEFITAMKAGNSYINIHTPGCATGEIRGQLVVAS